MTDRWVEIHHIEEYETVFLLVYVSEPVNYRFRVFPLVDDSTACLKESTAIKCLNMILIKLSMSLGEGKIGTFSFLKIALNM